MSNARKDILALIPARGGSKGIPRKNLADICGTPLIGFSISTALQLKDQNLVSDVLVSTDDLEIAEVSKKLGADVPFLRPEEYANDTAKTIDVMLHALDWYKENKGKEFSAVLLLQPTAPIRDTTAIADAVNLFLSSGNESLISVYKEEYINDLVMYKYASNDTKRGLPLHPNHNKGVRRQDHGSVFVRNGSIYISTSTLLKKGLIISDEPLLFEMDKNHSINIDTYADLELLKTLLCK